VCNWTAGGLRNKWRRGLDRRGMCLGNLNTEERHRRREAKNGTRKMKGKQRKQFAASL
jgi:hypothetical protein